VSQLVNYEFNRQYLTDKIKKRATEQTTLKKEPKDKSNKVHTLRSQSVAKTIEQREKERTLHEQTM
jgi:hypothetical protein